MSNIFVNLPVEVINYILLYGDLYGIIQLRLCCKRLKNLINVDYYAKLNTLIRDNDGYYEYIIINNRVIRHGIYKIYQFDFDLRSPGIYKDYQYRYGKKHGKCIDYFSNSNQVRQIRNYKNGIKCGKRIKYNIFTRVLELEYNYNKYGYLCGINKEYYDNDGDLYGNLSWYRGDTTDYTRRIRKIIKYNKLTKLYDVKEYYVCGAIKAKYSYRLSGGPKSSIILEGKYRQYYGYRTVANKRKIRRCWLCERKYYKNNKLHGRHVKYDYNGKKVFSHNYNNGRQHGKQYEFTYSYEYGLLMRVDIYDNNHVIERNYYRNKQLCSLILSYNVDNANGEYVCNNLDIDATLICQ